MSPGWNFADLADFPDRLRRARAEDREQKDRASIHSGMRMDRNFADLADFPDRLRTEKGESQRILLANPRWRPIARNLGKVGRAEGGESAESDAPDEFANRIVYYGKAELSEEAPSSSRGIGSLRNDPWPE
jgi:hypothetical protein